MKVIITTTIAYQTKTLQK